jgi:2Fe-2S ferredoxin
MPMVSIEGFDPFEVASGTTLLEACDDHGVPMTSACGGFAACNSCRITVLDGGAGLSALLEEEEAFLDNAAQRLGCQARVLGPVRLRLDPGC